ncbi:MAG TPA: hypothetical protein VFW41_12830 [Gaiellaceae bacterium]|nr:hypothetical protein [Gaiellaceae bacterium]
MRIILAASLGLLFLSAGVSASPGRSQAPRTPKLVVTRFRLHAAPVAVTTTPGAVWVVVETQGSQAQLRRLDPSSGRLRFSALIGRAGPDFGAATATGGVVFAAAGDHLIRAAAAAPKRIERTQVAGEAAAIAIGFHSVWVASIGQQRDWITRLNAVTLAVQARIPITVQPVALHAAFGSMWLATTQSLQKLNPATNRPRPTTVLTNNPIGLLIFAGQLWLHQLDDVMTAVAGPRSSGTQLALPFRPSTVAATPTRIWATDNCACMRGTIALLDARTHRLVAERKIGETPVALATDGDVAFVATFNDGTLSRVYLSD